MNKLRNLLALIAVAYVLALLADHTHILIFAFASGLTGGWLMGWLFGQQAMEAADAHK